MIEFLAIDLGAGGPPEICAECASRGVFHAPTETAILYCEHRLIGAYRVAGRDWKIIKAVEAGVFSDIVLRGLTQGELLSDVQRAARGEIARILEAQAKRSVMH